MVSLVEQRTDNQQNKHKKTTENQQNKTSLQKWDRTFQSMLLNKYNLCVCTIYSYHIQSTMLYALYSKIYMIKT